MSPPVAPGPSTRTDFSMPTGSVRLYRIETSGT